jgi:hypothetical protein
VEIKKILVGSEAAKLLPFAESRCRFFASTFEGFYTSRTIKSDDATIMIEVYAKNKGTVTIWASGGGYEFFCSSPTLTLAAAGDTGFSALCGSAVKVVLAKDASGKEKAKAVPKGSTLLPSSGDKGWSYSTDVLDMEYKYLRRQGWQIQGISQRVEFLKADGDKATLSAWCAASSLENINRKSGSAHEGDGYASRDIFYDASPTKVAIGDGSALKSVPDADWYRRASACVVKSTEFGDRTFYLMTTISGDLVVYTPQPRDLDMELNPAYELQQIKTNVDSKYAKTIPIVLPEKARKPVGKARDSVPLNYTPEDTQKELDDFPQYVWKFNDGCTKMVGIVYFETEPTYFQGKALKNGQDVDIKEALPGIAEFDISIKITGAGQDEFTISVTPSQTLNPFITDRVFLECDYSWKIKDVIDKNDLVAVESKVYKYSAGAPSPDDRQFMRYPEGDQVGAIATQSDAVIVNLTKEQDLHTFCMMRPNLMANRDTPVIYHDSATIIALDLRILAWVIQKDLIQLTSEGAGARDIVQVGFGPRYGVSYYYNKIERVTKLETWAYNKVEKEQYLCDNGQLNGLLDSRADGMDLQPIQARSKFTFVKPSTRGFEYKGDSSGDVTAFPYNETPEPIYDDEYDFSLLGTTLALGNAQIAKDLLYPNHSEVIQTTGLNGSSNKLEITELAKALYQALSNATYPQRPGLMTGVYDLPTGAYFYTLVGLPAVSTLYNDGFAVHPDGHWSVLTTHTLTYNGATQIARTGTDLSASPIRKIAFYPPTGYITAFFPVEKDKFVHECVDIIRLKGKESDVTTSHLEMYNSAFEKNHTVSDFGVEFKMRTEGWTFKNFVSFDAVENLFFTTKTYSVVAQRSFLVDFIEFVGDDFSMYARYSGLQTYSEYDNDIGFTSGPSLERPCCAALFDFRPSYLLAKLGPYLERTVRNGVEAENIDARVITLPEPATGNILDSGPLRRGGSLQPNAKLLAQNKPMLAGSRLYYGTLANTKKIKQESTE